jgi:hypothetical protein
MFASYVLVEGCGEWDCGVTWRSKFWAAARLKYLDCKCELLKKARRLSARLPAPATGVRFYGGVRM